MEEPTGLPQSRFLDVERHGDALHLSLRRGFDQSLGLRLRRRETQRRSKLCLARLGSVVWMPHESTFVLARCSPSTVEFAIVLNDLDDRLTTIAKRPLTAGEVEEVLGISARERSRWTKDGRLPHSGTQIIQRGQRIALSTYAPHEIARLMKEPETIRAWREADRDYGDASPYP